MQSETHNVFRYVMTFSVLVWETFSFKITLKSARLQPVGRISRPHYPLLLLNASNWMKYVPLLFVLRWHMSIQCLHSAKIGWLWGMSVQKNVLARWNYQQIQVFSPFLFFHKINRMQMNAETNYPKQTLKILLVQPHCLAELLVWSSRQATPQPCLVAVAEPARTLQGHELPFSHPAWGSALSYCCLFAGMALKWLRNPRPAVAPYWLMTAA